MGEVNREENDRQKRSYLFLQLVSKTHSPLLLPFFRAPLPWVESFEVVQSVIPQPAETFRDLSVQDSSSFCGLLLLGRIVQDA